MIVFDLECSQGHVFEGWFNDIPSFEKQNKKNMVVCPYCDDTKIKRVLSPVATRVSHRNAEIPAAKSIDYGKLAKEVVDYINKNFQDVGPDFTKEALKMHYGAADKQNIRGSATVDEEKTLEEEGVEFFKVPLPKTDENKEN
ncbi:DUF1178 family protein [Thermodesulfobacteriota bacterium]